MATGNKHKTVQEFLLAFDMVPNPTNIQKCLWVTYIVL